MAPPLTLSRAIIDPAAARRATAGATPLRRPPALGDAQLGGTRSQKLSYYFLVGGARSSTPFHMHSDGWNALVFGTKRWSVGRSVGPFVVRPSMRLRAT